MLKRYRFLILFALFVYFFGLYKSFFISEEVYIYDRESDRVFYLRLIPNFRECDALDIWLPGKKCSAWLNYKEDAKYLFKLSEFKKRKTFNQNLEKKDPNLYLRIFQAKATNIADKLIKRLENQASENHQTEEQEEGKEFGIRWDFSLININKIESNLIPTSLADFFIDEDKIKNIDIISANLVIIKSNRVSPHEPEISYVRDALIFSGEGAKQFVSYIDPRRWTLSNYDYKSEFLLDEEDLNNFNSDQ